MIKIDLKQNTPERIEGQIGYLINYHPCNTSFSLIKTWEVFTHSPMSKESRNKLAKSLEKLGITKASNGSYYIPDISSENIRYLNYVKFNDDFTKFDVYPKDSFVNFNSIDEQHYAFALKMVKEKHYQGSMQQQVDMEEKAKRLEAQQKILDAEKERKEQERLEKERKLTEERMQEFKAISLDITKIESTFTKLGYKDSIDYEFILNSDHPMRIMKIHNMELLFDRHLSITDNENTLCNSFINLYNNFKPTNMEVIAIINIFQKFKEHINPLVDYIQKNNNLNHKTNIIKLFEVIAQYCHKSLFEYFRRG